MAVRLATGSDYLHRNTNIVAASSNYTALFWVKANSSFVGRQLQATTDIDYSNWANVSCDSSLEKIFIDAGSPETQSTYASVNPAIWYPITYVRNGNTQSLYVSGVLIGSGTVNLSAYTFTDLFLGNDGVTGVGNLDFYNYREWNTALNVTQINAEINSPSAVVHTSGLVTFTPLTSDLLDVSGNGNNWTAVGTPTFVADPLPPTAGSLFIPSDHFDSVKGSAVIIDSSSGAVLTTLPFVTADQGGRLSSGIWAVAAQVSSSSGNVNAVNVYDTGFNLLGAVTIANWFSPPFTASKNFFYIQNPSNPFTVEQITSSGSLSGSSWNLSGKADAIAVTDDDSVLYWKDGLTIHAFDLVNNVALPDVLVMPLGTQLQDQIIIVNSTSFIIAFTNSTIALDWEAQQYDKTGTLVKTYGPVTNAGDYDAPEIFLDYNLSYFWMRAFDTDTDTTSTWYKFTISSSAVATTFTTPDMDGGGTVPTTCPVIPMGAALVGTIIVGKASVPVNSETFTMNVTGPVSQSFSIGFQGTESLSLPPGTYSIVEVPDTLYQPQYNTSNDDPNTAIVLSAGQLIDLVIVNQLSAKYGGLYQLVPGKTNDTLRNQDGSTTDKIINWFFELFTDRNK